MAWKDSLELNPFQMSITFGKSIKDEAKYEKTLCIQEK
jgi:hypothetical protein